MVVNQKSPCPEDVFPRHGDVEENVTLFSFCCFFPFASTDHLGARNVTVLVNEVEVSRYFLDADFCDLLGLAAFFVATGHLRARYVAALVHKVEVSFLFLNTRFRYFLSHWFTSFY